MTISLNHTIIAVRDSARAANFLTEILDLPAFRKLGLFTVVQVGETSLDYMDTDAAIPPRHFAFLVSEAEFDQIFERIRQRKLTYWADPGKQEPGQINQWDDGRGLYFEDPNGHLLEILTRPYGSGGLDAIHPNPLLSY